MGRLRPRRGYRTIYRFEPRPRRPELRVLRNETGAHPAITGEFTILGFPELISPDVVYLEHTRHGNA